MEAKKIKMGRAMLKEPFRRIRVYEIEDTFRLTFKTLHQKSKSILLTKEAFWTAVLMAMDISGMSGTQLDSLLMEARMNRRGKKKGGAA